MVFFPNVPHQVLMKQYVQAYNLVANSRHEIIIPDDEVWEIIEAGAYIIDSGTLSVFLHSRDDINHGYITYAAATTGPVVGPKVGTGANYVQSGICLMLPGERIRYQFGTAQTTGGDHVWVKYVRYKLEDLKK